jgi:hypothetical protein
MSAAPTNTKRKRDADDTGTYVPAFVHDLATQAHRLSYFTQLNRAATDRSYLDHLSPFEFYPYDDRRTHNDERKSDDEYNDRLP